MTADRELLLLLAALRDGAINPTMLAEAAAAWPSTGPETDLMRFLVGRGALSTEDLERLERATTEASGVAPEPTAALPSGSRTAGGDPDATSDHRPDPDGTADRRPSGGGSTVPRWAAATVGLESSDGDSFSIDGPEAPEAVAGRYEILQLYRTGGLGQVWRARDRVLGREVALKTIRPDRAGLDGARLRFVREARVTGRLEHPSIVPLYDLSADGDDPFYVMRFVSGRTLAEAAADYHRRRAEGTAGPLDLTALLEAFVGVCRAVAFAHSRKVLHRDLKGQNVVVGAFGEVFLLDWGLAKPFVPTPESTEPEPGPASDGAPPGSGSDATLPGSAVGTPAYMAPEVASGAEASRSSDVYGLGAILFSLLTGSAPYTGSNPRKVLAKVRTTPPPPVRSINPEAPPALEAIVAKAMARDPGDRYDSAEEVATEVRRWLADEPVAAFAEPRIARIARWARRRKAAVLGVAIFLLTASVISSASAALLWRSGQQTAAARDEAEGNAELAREEQLRAEENAQLALGVSSDALRLIQSVEWVLASTEVLHEFRKRLLDSGSRAFRDHLAGAPDDPTVRSQAAQIFLYTAGVARLEGRHEAADALYRDAIGLLEGPAAGGAVADPAAGVLRCDALKDRAVLFTVRGPQRRADALYERSLALLEPFRDRDGDSPIVRRSRARTLLNRCVTLRLLGEAEASLAAARESAELLAALIEGPPERQNPYDPILLARALTLLAVREREAGRPRAAIELHARAGEVIGPMNRTTTFGVNQADVAWTAAYCRLERGNTWAREGDPRAWGALDAAVLGYERLAEAYPWVLGYRSGLADALLVRGERKAAAVLPGAAEDFERALPVAEALVAEHPDVQPFRSLLGRVALRLAGAVADAARRDALLRLAEEQLAAAVAADPEIPDDRAALAEVRAAPR